MDISSLVCTHKDLVKSCLSSDWTAAAVGAVVVGMQFTAGSAALEEQLTVISQQNSHAHGLIPLGEKQYFLAIRFALGPPLSAIKSSGWRFRCRRGFVEESERVLFRMEFGGWSV